jgi:hypothetical protein
VEIAAALQREIPVIPILLEGTTVPSADQLPKDLQELSLRNGIDVRHASFHNDIDRLVRGLKGQDRALQAQIASEAETQPDMKWGRDKALHEAAAREAQVERPTVTKAGAFQIKFAKGIALKSTTREPASTQQPAPANTPLEELAAKGDASAMNNLGEFYHFGRGGAWRRTTSRRANGTRRPLTWATRTP